MKKNILIFTLLAITTGCGQSASIKSSSYYNQRLQIGRQVLIVEIAKTPEALKKGLSSRGGMQQNQGMLFEFGLKKQSPAFWMKDMRFNLDLIWIAEGKIIGITADVRTPDVHCQSSTVNCLPTYRPPSPVNQVLEVNAGWAEKNKVKVGDETKLLN